MHCIGVCTQGGMGGSKRGERGGKGESEWEKRGERERVRGGGEWGGKRETDRQTGADR